MIMKKNIIFDFDWTLVASLEYIKNIIWDYFDKNYPSYLDTIRYSVAHSNIWNFDDLINIALKDKINSEEIEKIKKDLFDKINKNTDEVWFIPWTIETIEKIKDDFNLFVSTWNSTGFATKMLKKWWVFEYFKIVLWSEKIPKTIEHVEFMKDKVQDDDFYSKSIFVWDWERDKEIAKAAGMKYIKIWLPDWVSSISEIDFYSL